MKRSPFVGPLLLILLLITASSMSFGSTVGSFFLTGHDPDFHAIGSVGAQHINQIAISYVMNPTFNPFVAAGVNKFLYVAAYPSDIGGVPGGHVDGEIGIIDSGYVAGVNFDQVDAAQLPAALAQLGTTYSAIVVGSTFGGLLTQNELDVLDANKATIVDFLNHGGGIYAMSEGNVSESLAQGGGYYGYLPCIASAQGLDQTEAGDTLTAFGGTLGLVNSDVNSNFSHNIFTTDCGLSVVDTNNGIISLAGRGQVTGGGFQTPEPGSMALLASGLLGVVGLGRRKRIR